MDYEKKYKEALERAKKWLYAPNVNKIPTYANRVIEEIFPELTESENCENKRISKEIAWFLKQNNGWNKEWLAWLEKQGQVKESPISQHEIKTCKENSNSLTGEDERIRKAMHIYLDWLDGRKDYQPKGEYTIRNMVDWLEKQGETHTNKEFDDAWLRYVTWRDKRLEKQDSQILANSEKNCKDEQKPALSGEDDFMCNRIKNLLTDISIAPESRNSLIDWLDSMKQRIGG